MSAAWRALAPAKVNLGLFVGPVRADGRHLLATVMQSISLADELVLTVGGAGGADEVVCPGVLGRNLAFDALVAFRARTGWDGPPVRVEIDKRIPVAAGLAGGSADAAAALRLVAAASGVGDEALLMEVAGGLGADVPAQVRPGRWLAGGAGEVLTALPAPAAPLGVLVLPVAAQLSTAEVYGAFDAGRGAGVARSEAQIGDALRGLDAALADGAPLPDVELLVNDLQEPALSLCPLIGGALEQARAAGADRALVSGSGPTVVGLFAGAGVAKRLSAAAARLGGREDGAVVATPVGAGFGDPVVAKVRHNHGRA